MSKIEADKLELSPVTFNFEDMLRKVVNIMNYKVNEKHQHLSVDIDEKIPKFLKCDDQRLAQIITNLLSNAVKFTPERGGISLKAKLLGEESEICVIQIDVTDTGIGINAEQQARLFTSFAQAESSTTRKFGGTGLGLAISKRIVEMMGGRIWVRSEADKGSVFSFVIQAEKPEEESYADYLSVGQDEEETEYAQFDGRYILIAEDVEINREIVTAMLEPMKMNIECAINGVKAVEMFEAAPEKYDIIFMDVQMPEMDGHEATRTIRALDIPRAKEIPIVAMTANVFRDDIERCLEAGMNGHLGKPIDFDKMLALLRTYLK
jgi:CheY-like chemotaxis protein